MESWEAASRGALRRAALTPPAGTPPAGTLQAAAAPDPPGCPDCGGSGWVLVADGGAGTARECDCRKQGREGRILGAAGIPERYLGCRLDKFETTHTHAGVARQLARAVALSRAYVDGFLREDGRFADWGLIYIGPAGVGKTHLAAAVTLELIRRYRVRARFVEFTDLIHRIQATFGPDTPGSKSGILDPLIQAELLVLDELGSQKATEWVQDILYLIINGRYIRRLPTLFTTNCQLAERPGRRTPAEHLDRGADPVARPAGATRLAERLPANLISRLYEMAKPVVLDTVADFRHEVKFNTIAKR